jgi:hypothetical protein
MVFNEDDVEGKENENYGFLIVNTGKQDSFKVRKIIEKRNIKTLLLPKISGNSV